MIRGYDRWRCLPDRLLSGDYAQTREDPSKLVASTFRHAHRHYATRITAPTFLIVCRRYVGHGTASCRCPTTSDANWRTDGRPDMIAQSRNPKEFREGPAYEVWCERQRFGPRSKIPGQHAVCSLTVHQALYHNRQHKEEKNPRSSLCGYERKGLIRGTYRRSS